MLTARDLSVVLGRKPILSEVTVDLRPGELVAVIGPNGAGKSTLLQALAGGIQPQAGEVALDAVPLARWTREALALRRAVVPQDSVLAFPLSAVEVALLGRSPHRRAGTPRRDLAVVAEALQATGTDHLADRDYTTLSGGERQRVQFARALAQIWPGDGASGDGAGRYLLLDEPTASLDLKHQHQILRLARNVAARGHGVLAVLHDFNLAALYADRLVLLVEGRLVADGRPDQVLTADRVEEAFGMPVMVARHPRGGAPMVIPA